MFKLRHPVDIAGLALAATLASLALGQWRDAASFGENARTASAEVIELRTAQGGPLDPATDVYATVEFTPEGSTEPLRTELSRALRHLELEQDGLVGRTIEVLYDPAHPTIIRHGSGNNDRSPLALLALAIGALFAPAILRRSLLSGGGGG